MEKLSLVRLTPTLECYTAANPDAADDARFLHGEIFEERDYLRHGIVLPRDAFVVDAGANIGLFCLFVKHNAPDATVLAVEPMADTGEVLRRNLELHGLTDCHVYRCGLGARAETATFHHFPGLPANSTRYPDEKDSLRELMRNDRGAEVTEHTMRSHTEDVPVRPLSDLLREWPHVERIDLVKIDVEGAELEVLKGITETDWKRIGQLVVEVQQVDNRLEDVVDLLRTNGYTTTVERPAMIAPSLDLHMVYACR
ncbi:FkbM family methyltransferase [Umezawaea sp. Da 62-37]|uniref:FkbM family methyltransferase n=1 Tax=Umezawaea sp. Da 62-37 TaxID=3075927 RepID=UPI0028F6C36A|nr:FkbM family methyltransferase [Umezawaea sp. Da 62-37]WNV87685.1 FkbM family methyltransferase [Umezawaea sp. Da 62-37]